MGAGRVVGGSEISRGVTLRSVFKYHSILTRPAFIPVWGMSVGGPVALGGSFSSGASCSMDGTIPLPRLPSSRTDITMPRETAAQIAAMMLPMSSPDMLPTPLAPTPVHPHDGDLGRFRLELVLELITAATECVKLDLSDVGSPLPCYLSDELV